MGAKTKGKSKGTGSVARAIEKANGDPNKLVANLAKAVRGSMPPGAKLLAPGQNTGGIDVASVVRQAAMQIAPSVGMTPDNITEALIEQGMGYDEPMAPGRPLNPYFGYGRTPRAFNYQVGRNISTRPRQYRVPFDTLTNLIQSYDVAQVCVRHIIDDLRSMPLLFSPMDGVEEDVTDEIERARQFLMRPDGEWNADGKRVGGLNWHEWLGMWGQDIFRYDGGNLYKQRDRAGRVTGLEIVDTRTIAPLIDYNGRIPRSPAPAYLQFVQGLPWDWITRDDNIYTRMNPLPEDVYGLAPIEAVLMTANSDLRYQWYWLQYFTDGTVPDGFMEAPPDMSSPEQLQGWQEIWENWLLGDQSQKVKIRWVPKDSKYTAAKNPAFDKNFPIWLMRHTVAAYGLTPQDLGWTDDVNRATGETQTDIQFRISTMPKSIGLEYVLNYVIQMDLGLRVKVRFDTGREKEDRLQEAQAMLQYINGGVISPDEVRAMIFGLKVQADEMIPRFIMSERLGPIPLSYLISVGGIIDKLTGAPEPGSVVPSQFVLPGNQAPDPMSTPEEQTLMAIAQHAAQFPDKALALPPELKMTPEQAAESNVEAAETKGEPPPGGPGGSGSVPPALGPGAGQPGQDKPTGQRQKKGTASNSAKGKRKGQAGKRALNPKGGAGPKGSLAKSGAPVAAGIALRAADTGRVLMLQRSVADPDDPAAGDWEFPGGRIDPTDATPMDAARREFEEEVGVPVPASATEQLSWESPNGAYIGVVYEVPTEDDVPINLQTGRALNPDDPDGDDIETACWWDPADASKLPNLRAEVRLTPWHIVDGSIMAKQADPHDYVAIGRVLRQWRKAAQDRVRQGRPTSLWVDSDLPEYVSAVVWEKLERATTRDEVDAAFMQKAVPASGNEMKITKADAHYRQAAFPTIRCFTCSHMQSDGSCTLVEGQVAPNMLCDYFSYDNTKGEAMAKDHQLIEMELADYVRRGTAKAEIPPAE